jgi:hypothetical protein
MKSLSFLLAAALLGVSLVAGGCAQSASSEEPATGRADALTDRAYLTAPLWNDGQAEVAFYRVERSQSAGGALGNRPADESFLAGTYLVKQRFNAQGMTKAGHATGQAADADAIDAFKYALFYERESGSYEFKRNWVTNARQRDLRPIKASFSSFDWCSNLYEEFAFRPSSDSVRYLKRSDDYGNTRGTFARRPGAFPAQMVPLVVRGLDFSEKDQRAFAVLRPDGSRVNARARLAGADSLALPAQEGTRRRAAERIVVTYDAPAPSMLADQTGTEETYWRGTGPARLLLKVEGDGYRMTLEEALRSPYWEENVWEHLARVSERP